MIPAWHTGAGGAIMTPADARSMADNTSNFRDERASDDERLYTVFQHLAGLLNIVSGVPFLGLVATIILWRIRAKDSVFLDDHGREATNFQLSLLTYTLGGGLLAAFLGVFSLGLLAPLIAIFAVIGGIGLLALMLVGSIKGAMAAHRREYFRYPMCIRYLIGPQG